MTLTAPRDKAKKRLFAVSGNKCNFPNCNTPLVDLESGTITGEICHIKGKKPDSPRYDSNQSDEGRHGFDNLILMCGFHHKVIDDDPDSYTVSRLLDIKKNHEQLNIGGKELSDIITNLFIKNVTDGSIIFTQDQKGGQVAHSIININYKNGGNTDKENKDHLKQEIIRSFEEGDFKSFYASIFDFGFKELTRIVQWTIIKSYEAYTDGINAVRLEIDKGNSKSTEVGGTIYTYGGSETYEIQFSLTNCQILFDVRQFSPFNKEGKPILTDGWDSQYSGSLMQMYFDNQTQTYGWHLFQRPDIEDRSEEAKNSIIMYLKEKLNLKPRNRQEERLFQEFYNVLKGNYSAITQQVKFKTIIRKIGISSIEDVLVMLSHNNGQFFSNEQWRLLIRGMGGSYIDKIDESDDIRFSFSDPNRNSNVREEFLSFFIKQCNLKNINIRR